MIKVQKQKAEDLKAMIDEGLHIFGRAMSLAEEMCNETEMSERRGNFNYRDDEYLYPMSERNFRHMDMREEDYRRMDERRMRDSRGRYM